MPALANSAQGYKDGTLTYPNWGATGANQHKYSENAASFYKSRYLQNYANGNGSRPHIEMINSVGGEWSATAAVGNHSVASYLAATRYKTAYCQPHSTTAWAICVARYP